MPSWQRTYLTLCAAITGFALAYFACDFGGWPRLLHDPWAHDWRWSDRPTSFDSLYLGTVLWGAIGAVLIGGLTWLVLGFSRRELSARVNLLAVCWALTAFLFTGGYFMWNLWPF